MFESSSCFVSLLTLNICQSFQFKPFWQEYIVLSRSDYNLNFLGDWCGGTFHMLTVNLVMGFRMVCGSFSYIVICLFWYLFANTFFFTDYFGKNHKQILKKKFCSKFTLFPNCFWFVSYTFERLSSFWGYNILMNLMCYQIWGIFVTLCASIK